MTTPARRWTVRTTGDIRQWLRALRQTDPEVYRSVNVAIDILAEIGPGLGRPLVDTLRDSKINNLKELRPRSGRDVSIRIRVRPLVPGSAAGSREQGRRLAALVRRCDSRSGDSVR